VPSHVPKLPGLPAASAARYYAGTYLTPFGAPDDGGEAPGIAVFDLPAIFAIPRYCHACHYGLLAANPFGLREQTRPTENGKQWMTGPCGPEPNDRSWTSELARASTGKGPKATA
jgi:hypothetical protein